MGEFWENISNTLLVTIDQIVLEILMEQRKNIIGHFFLSGH